MVFCKVFCTVPGHCVTECYCFWSSLFVVIHTVWVHVVSGSLSICMVYFWFFSPFCIESKNGQKCLSLIIIRQYSYSICPTAIICRDIFEAPIEGLLSLRISSSSSICLYFFVFFHRISLYSLCPCKGLIWPRSLSLQICGANLPLRVQWVES